MITKPIGSLSIILLAALAAGSCSKDNPVGPPVVTSVAVTPGTDTLIALGRTRQFSAVPKDANGNPVPGVTVVWRSSNPAVAAVDSATGIVTAVGNGLSVIRADAGGVVGQATLAVVQLVATVLVTPGSAGLATVGATQGFSAVAKDSGNATVAGVRFVWQSSDPSVAVVDTAGLAHSKGPGQAIITATGRGIPGNAVLTVTQASASLVFVVQPTATVAGEAINPALQVEVRDSAGHLVAGSRAAVTLAFGVNPHGATLHGSTTVNAVGGVATFSGITVETADNGYTLTASATAINQGTSAAFDVGPAVAKALRFIQLDVVDTAGQAPPFQVEAIDRFGNRTPTTGAVFLQLKLAPPGGVLINSNFAAVMSNGLASLTVQVIQKAGTVYMLSAGGTGGAAGLDSAFSPVFTVRPATATRLKFTHVQSGSSLGSPLFTTGVAFRDAFGNAPDTSGTVTVSIGVNPWGATLLGTASGLVVDSVVFAPLTVTKLGTYRLVASASGFTPDTSGPVAVTFGIPSSLATGGTHSCTLSNGVAVCWGYNGTGQLGRPASSGDSVPGLVAAGGRTFTTLASGPGHSCALTSAGAAYCWGDNSAGQLGGTTGSGESDTAQAVTGGHTFTAIAGGGKHTCALATDSTAYCWGDNASGQLGDSGREASSATPVAAYGGRKYIAIAAGANHTCAVGADSSAYCWGDNSFGQLGDSVATGTSDTAVLVRRGHKFRPTIVSGDNHTCALDRLTTPWCWGRNNHGQLGNHALGVNADTAVVVAVWGGTGTGLGAGGDHTCGLRNSTPLCWGSNTYGELGYGTPPTDNDQPAVVSFSFGVAQVTAGSSHSCAISNFVVYCWGRNAAGQVGDATTTDRSRPATVGP